MLLCSLHQIRTPIIECRRRKSRLIRPGQRFFQSSIVQLEWVVWNCILRVLFLADRSGTRCDLLLRVTICFSGSTCSEMVFCIPWYVTSGYWVTVSFLSSVTSLPILLWPLPLTGYFLFFWPFSVNSIYIYAFSRHFYPKRLTVNWILILICIIIYFFTNNFLSLLTANNWAYYILKEREGVLQSKT